MKRSESVLVYAVTAVLAVILVVAVVFGHEEPARAGGQGAGGREAATNVAQLLDVQDFGDLGSGGSGSDGPGTGDVPAGPGGLTTAAPGTFPEEEPAPGEVGAAPQFAVPVGPLRAAAGSGGVAAVLGAFELERSWNGELFRIYEVQAGETFSELVQRWTGSLDDIADVQALNEDVDLERLKVGQVLRFPFVDDAELLLAREARRTTAKPAVASVGSGAGVIEASAPKPVAAAAPGASYTIQKGDSLWSIAERHVGVGNAEAYVRAILAANPRIKDAGRIRAGDRIDLPSDR
jgi:LysM repeat protein